MSSSGLLKAVDDESIGTNSEKTSLDHFHNFLIKSLISQVLFRDKHVKQFIITSNLNLLNSVIEQISETLSRTDKTSPK